MKHVFILLLLINSINMVEGQGFVDEQLKYERVRQAKADYDAELKRLFEARELNYPPSDIYIRAFKFDKIVEVWIKEDDQYLPLKTFDMCATSGELGPKRKQGDLQIPEGFYELSHFNPVSNFYLSLRVNYPNESDRILSHAQTPGGDIYIHGDCQTIGCIPIEDEGIKELYWLSVLSKNQGGSIPIHIFPFHMDDASIEFFSKLPATKGEHWDFWNQLKPIYDYFEVNRQIPVIEVTKDGRYVSLK